jgi:hypothetical protein
MIRRILPMILLLAVCLALPADAARAKRKAPARKAPTTQVKAKTAPAAAKAAPPAAKTPPARAAAPRRLEDIHIEGEIPAPQVLFVTARDQRRYTRFHHQRYLKTSVQVGETTQLPTRVGLTSPKPTPAGAP